MAAVGYSNNAQSCRILIPYFAAHQMHTSLAVRLRCLCKGQRSDARSGDRAHSFQMGEFWTLRHSVAFQVTGIAEKIPYAGAIVAHLGFPVPACSWTGLRFGGARWKMRLISAVTPGDSHSENPNASVRKGGTPCV